MFGVRVGLRRDCQVKMSHLGMRAVQPARLGQDLNVLESQLASPGVSVVRKMLPGAAPRLAGCRQARGTESPDRSHISAVDALLPRRIAASCRARHSPTSMRLFVRVEGPLDLRHDGRKSFRIEVPSDNSWPFGRSQGHSRSDAELALQSEQH